MFHVKQKKALPGAYFVRSARGRGLRMLFWLARCFVCALTLADDGSCRSIVFFACAAGGQKASGAGLLSITAPRGRGGRTLPASGLHPSPRRAYLGLSASLLNGVWSNGGWNKFHHAYRLLIYRGHLQDERHFLYYSSLAPFWEAERVSPFSFAEVKVLCGNVRAGSNIYAVHLY